MPNRFDLVIFDWDGTLMDSTAMIASSIQYACRDIGLPIPSDEDASHVIGLGLGDALSFAVPQLKPDQLPLMIERYRHHYLSREADLCLFPEVTEMLDVLRGRGQLLAVATGKNRNGLDRALVKSALGSRFHATRTSDEARSKPHPQMLYDLLEKLDVAPERALMIGDTTHDLQMATNAGMSSVGVAYGAHQRASLDALAPLAVLESSRSLRAWLCSDGEKTE